MAKSDPVKLNFDWMLKNGAKFKSFNNNFEVLANILFNKSKIVAKSDQVKLNFDWMLKNGAKFKLFNKKRSACIHCSNHFSMCYHVHLIVKGNVVLTSAVEESPLTAFPRSRNWMETSFKCVNHLVVFKRHFEFSKRSKKKRRGKKKLSHSHRTCQIKRLIIRICLSRSRLRARP